MNESGVFNDDPTMRLICAFNDYAIKNPNWEQDSNFSRNNRQIRESMVREHNISADHYFNFNCKLYATNHEIKDNGLIECEIQEYSKYYDIADSYISVRFLFNPNTRLLERLDEAIKIPNVLSY